MLTGLFSVFAAFGLMMLLVAGGVVVPVMVAIFAVVLALWIAFAVLGLVFRLIGGILLLLVAMPLMLVGAALAVAFGVALVPLALPLLFIAALAWVLTRRSRSAPTPALPSPASVAQ